MEELFLEGLNKSAHASKATIKPKTASRDLYPYVEQLLEMLNDSAVPLQQTWTLFTTEICPRVIPKEASTPYSLHFASKSLFRKLVAAHRRSPVPDGIPSVSEITRTHACMSLLSPKDCSSIMDTFFTQDTYERLSTEGEDVAEDILESWRAILARQSYSGRAPSECTNTPSRPAWVLPHLNPIKVKRHMQAEGVEHAFTSLLHPYLHSALQGLASRALFTFAMLTDPRIQPEISVASHHPFMVGIANVILMGDMTPVMLERYIKSLELPYGEMLKVNWSSVIAQAQRLTGLSSAAQTKSIPPGASMRQMPFTENPVFRSMAKAIAIKDLGTVTRLWEKVKTWPPRHVEAQGKKYGENDGAESPITRELGHQFIVAFTAMNKAKAVEVWNSLIQWGYQPTCATWHAMLEGSKISRDSKALLGIWAKMLNFGIVPDVGCWTTLISGLMYSGNVEGGVRAVVGMKTAWEAAAKAHLAETNNRVPLRELGDMPGAVKPTTAVINAVMVNLLRRNKIEVASRMLSMGGEIGLRPDRLTYNTILRALVRKRDDAALKALLAQMEKQGVKGDVVTFTTILESSLAHVEESTPEEVVKLIDQLFAEMEAADIKPNETTYSAIINSILRRAPSLDYLKPVEHVLKRMESQKLKPTAHVQTMLLNFHFKQESPNLDAINVLLAKFTRAASHRDHIFWDRVIEGYSGMDETVRALQALRQSIKEGFKPGYDALEMAIHALHRNGEMELGRQLVTDIGLQRGGPLPDHVRGVDGQHRFWRSAEDLGLILHDLEERIERDGLVKAQR